MDVYYYMLAFMFAFIFIVLFFLTRSANRIAKEREAEAAANGDDANSAAPMGTTRQRRARREE